MEFPRNMYTVTAILKLSELSLIMCALFVSEETDAEIHHITLLLTLAIIPLGCIILIIFTKYDILHNYLVGLQVLHIVISVIWIACSIPVGFFYATHIDSHNHIDLVLLVILVAVLWFVILELVAYIITVYRRITFKSDGIPRLSDIDLTHPIELVSASKLTLLSTASQTQYAASKRRKLATASDLSMLGVPVKKDEIPRRDRPGPSFDSQQLRDTGLPIIDVRQQHREEMPMESIRPDNLLFAVTASHVFNINKTTTAVVDGVLEKATDIVSKMNPV